MWAVQCLHLIASGVLRAFSNERSGNDFVSYTHSSSGIAAHYCQTEEFGSTLKRLPGSHFGFEIAVPADDACYRVFPRKLIDKTVVS
jgi:hypothetical protein